MSTTAFRSWLAEVRVRAKAAREALGLSLRAAEEKTGVAFRTIYRVETEDFDPTLEVLFKLAVGYGVSVSELLCGPQSVPRAR